ncbi:MAG: FHA domain-containing protein [Anaerolineales bacterium]|nr:FHA domain-containing protein [Anaerolineales bacterium]
MMNVDRRPFSWIKSWVQIVGVIVCLASLVLVPVLGHAQGAARALINYPEIVEGADSVSLNLYFTMIDGSGQVVTETEEDDVVRGTVTLGDGQVFDANVGKPSSNAYVALVLDASGSMLNVMGQMKEAASQAVESAPEEASFSVIQFNNQIEILQDFTQDKDTVTEAIGRSFAVQDSGTCLYDAAYRAIELLGSAPQGRRAVVLFTDGKDELARGGPCSQHTYDELVSFATRQDAPVPIHTIGLTTQGMTAADEARLQELSESTGGFSQTGGQGSLSLLFDQIISTMSHQWLAQAEIYPSQGENSAQLTVVLEDGGRIESEPVTFDVSQEYVAPPGARVRSLSYTGGGDVIMNLDLNRADEIATFELQLVDIENNVTSPPFDAEVDTEVNISASRFEQGTDYRLLIRGLDPNGGMLFESRYEFTYDPTIREGELQILAVELDTEDPAFTLNISASNLENVSHYEVWLNDKEDNTVVPGTRQEVEPGDDITIPLGDVPNGTYNVVLAAVSGDGSVITQTTYDDAVYELGFVTRLGRFVRGSWPFLACLFLLFMVSMGVLFKVVVLDSGDDSSEGVLLETPVSAGGDDDPWSPEAIERSRQRLRGEAGDESPRAPERGRAQQGAPSPPKPSPPKPEPSPPKPQQPSPPAAAPGGQKKRDLPPVELAVTKTPDGNYVGRTYKINTVPFTIGRGGNVLDLEYAGVSRKHASILFADGSFYLRDEGSTNGTTLNGESIEANKDIPLKPGSEIGLGKRVMMTFRQTDGSS